VYTILLKLKKRAEKIEEGDETKIGEKMLLTNVHRTGEGV